MNPPVSPPENLVIFEMRGTWDEQGRPALGPGFLGFWLEDDYTFLFFDREVSAEARCFLEDEAGLELRCIHRMKYSDWQDGAGFAPFTVGPLTIAPAWSGAGLAPGRPAVLIDPGLAFGFGGHPTTRACLEALVRVYREDHPGLVLDLGAGTGVLGLAALRLGADRVRAVEYSHLAAETAQKNAAINSLEERLEVIRGQAEEHHDFPASLVCSNLHLPVQLAVHESGGFAGRRWLILSGLFHSQAEQMEKILLSDGYRLVDRVRDERWATLLLIGPSSGG